MDKTYEEEVENIVDMLREKVREVLPEVEVVVVPSTDDVLSVYPMPQPPLDIKPKPQVKLVSNPTTLTLHPHLSPTPSCTINLINYDLIHYID